MTSERHAEFHHQLVRILSNAGDSLRQLLSGDDSGVRKVAERSLGKVHSADLRIGFRKLPPGLLLSMQGGSPASMFFISTAGEAPRFFSCSEDWQMQGNITGWKVDELLPDRIRRTLESLKKPNTLHFCAAVRNILARHSKRANPQRPALRFPRKNR